MQQRPLNVLVVEHDPEQSPELTEELERAETPPLEVERVGELAGAMERLAEGGIDVVLLDLDLPDSRGAETFERMYAFAPDVPVVVLTGRGDPALAMVTVQGGAQDHLLRAEATPGMVLRALRYAVERHRLLAALRSLSLIDDLTGLYNRRGFVELGEQFLKLARRNDRHVTLVLLDLDHFRTINEGLGHHVGDRALKKVADILRATFRRSDVTARLRADRFAVLAFEASTEAAELLVERVQERIADFNDNNPEAYRLSATIALARHDGDGVVHLEELLAEATETLEARKARRVAEAS